MNDANEFDVVIVGGGPGGLAALDWCSELGLSAILLEKQTEFGGQLLYTFNSITNYPGITSASGLELRDKLMASGRKGDRVSGAEVVEVDLARKYLRDASGRSYTGLTLIIATGVRRRELSIPGERELRGRGVLDSGAKNRTEVAGKKVVIIGGGDAALENALILSETAEKVLVAHRRDVFTARAEFINRACNAPNVEFLKGVRPTSIHGSNRVEGIQLEYTETGERQIVEADAVLIRIGVIPNTEMLRGKLELDEAGYVIVNSRCETSVAGVFAIGDVVNRYAPTISAAVGQASIAIKGVMRDLKR